MSGSLCRSKSVVVILLSLLASYKTTGSVAAEAQRSSGKHADLLEQLRSAIETCDVRQLSEASSKIFRDNDAVDVVLYLASQWNVDSTGDSWACIRRPLVRAHLANTLAQAYGNDVSDAIDVSSVRTALRAGASSTMSEIASLSITGLDFVAEPSDLKLFEKIALSNDTFRRDDAIAALASQCSSDAGDVLDRLERRLPSDMVRKARSQFAIVRESRCRQGLR